jgi:PHD/YefM family antitoxin component YafN of YafNO toxin-antitoxin module
MTTTLATIPASDEEPWHSEAMHSEPLEDAARHLPALADEIDSTRARILLTRPDRPDLVLLPADELRSIEETLFWCRVESERARAGAPADEDVEPGPAMTADDARAYFARRLAARPE